MDFASSSAASDIKKFNITSVFNTLVNIAIDKRYNISGRFGYGIQNLISFHTKRDMFLFNAYKTINYTFSYKTQARFTLTKKMKQISVFITNSLGEIDVLLPLFSTLRDKAEIN